jgi:hypothetical protein
MKIMMRCLPKVKSQELAADLQPNTQQDSQGLLHLGVVVWARVVCLELNSAIRLIN